VFDTNLVIVGNLLANPEWRRAPGTGDPVVNFRVASTARRRDKETGEWVDGRSLRVRVTAWRRLADGVAASLRVGDPVIVFGRLYTSDWMDENGGKRVSYELEAYSVGHDLGKGRSSFARTKAVTAEDADDEMTMLGDGSVPMPDEEAPVRFGDDLPPLEAVLETPDSADDLTMEVERLAAEQSSAARRSRRPKRETVAA
jgi:single-strand DNA-binding protein